MKNINLCGISLFCLLLSQSSCASAVTEDEKAVNRWIDIVDVRAVEFATILLSTKDRSLQLKKEIAKFGSKKDEDDLRWILGYPRFLLSQFKHRKNDLPSVREIASMMNERFLGDTELLKRYYHLTIWAGKFNAFGVNVKKVNGTLHIRSRLKSLFGRSEEINDELTKNAQAASDPLVLRKILLLFIATDRGDLLLTLDPEKPLVTFKEWRKWFHAEIFYLRQIDGEPRWRLSESAKENKDVLPVDKNKILSRNAPFPGWKSKQLSPGRSIVSIANEIAEDTLEKLKIKKVVRIPNSK